MSLDEALARAEARIAALEAELREARDAEAALRVQFAFQATLVDAIPVPVFYKDAAGVYRGANAAFAAYLGRPREAIVGKTVYEVAPPELADIYAASDQALFDHPGVQEYETRVRAWDGAEHDVRFYKATYTHPDGSIAGLVGTIFDVTARKRAEDALRALTEALEERVAERTAALAESEERFHTLAALAPVGIYLTDAQGNCLFVNEQWMAIAGLTQAEAAGQGWVRAIHPDDRARVNEAWYAAAQRGADFGGEYRFRTPDGRITWIIGRSHTIRDASGLPTGHVGTILDITERKRAEDALRESEARLAEAERLAHLGSYVHNIPDGPSIWSTEAYHIIGRDPTEGVPGLEEYLARYVHPDDRDHFTVVITHASETMGAFASEHRVVCPDGGVRVIHSIGGITPGAGGQGLRIFGTMQDITERKQAEARLHELLARVEQWAAEMDATISSIADGVIVLSPDGAIVRMNAAAGDIFGVAHGAVPATYGELLAQLGVETPEGEAIRLENATTPHALLGETTLGLVRRFTRADGQHRWTSTSAAPIRMADGAITGAVLTFSDITILRELQQRQEELVHLVSHDLRIPLTVIHGHAELLEDALAEVHVDGDTALSLRAIDRAVQRMDVMIQDLVNMARLEGQRADLALEPVALAPFLRDMLGRMTGILDVGRMALDVPDDLPPILADYTRLERIILNLLTNALKYSAPGTPVLIRARADDDHLTIMVIDQGEGIPPEELPHLFDRFYRAKGGRVAEGLGLGLYITRMLVEAMHGHIAVTSAPGQGSTFAVTLPCK